MFIKSHSFAFVDGSYNPKNGTYGFGVILFDKFGKKHVFNGYGSKVNMGQMRNVAGEILGAEAAIKAALKLRMKELTIYHDYEGIEKWVTGKWCARKKETKQYVDMAKKAMSSGLKLYFKHVKAHSGISLNEEADILAKKAVGLG